MKAASNTFTVRLANAPAADVTVNVARTAGDSDINVTGGATLVFTPGEFRNNADSHDLCRRGRG